jgi:hypothetical protein
MLRKTGWLIVMIFSLTISCKNMPSIRGDRNASSEKTDKSADGGFMLKIEDADLVQDESNPEINTAEWSFSVDHPGRYEVWLSSFTCDSMNLGFDTAVTITAGDSRLEKMPKGDEIRTFDNGVHSPGFRADSEMGTVFFSKAGEYVVQVISEKVMSPQADTTGLTAKKQTLIKSVILKPVIY